MGAPLATSSDLEVFLGMTAGTIDTARATALLQYAQDECESVVNPLPATAKGVVIGVAARAFINPTSAQSEGLGSAHVSFQGVGGVGIGGLYLSRADKSALRRLAGRGSAFTADTLPTGMNAVQSITVAATSGTFTLTFSGATTTPIAYNATAAQVLAALTALTPIGSGNVSVTGTYSVTFTNKLGLFPMPLLTADGTGLAGGTVAVTTTTPGVAAPGATLPPWDNDYTQDSRLLGSQIYGY